MRSAPMDHEMDGGLGRRLEYEQSPQPAEAQDVTLGMPALLGIFFAVILVCAVFFGFGYSTGRAPHGAKAPQGAGPVTTPSSSPSQFNSVTPDTGPGSAPDPSPESSSLPGTSSLQAAEPPLIAPAFAKPSPAGAPQEAPASRAASEPAGPPMSESSRGASSVSVDAARRSFGAGALHGADETAPGQTSRSGSVALPAADSTSTAPANVPATIPGKIPGNIMVQIAAVMHQQDADSLASALRSNGYNAVVRTAPNDKFLHVQVGPFATRDEARAMRARLAHDGYNPFIKP